VNRGVFPEEFAANKKWAMSPLLSPPAGVFTGCMADKFVCMSRIGQFATKFNLIAVEKRFSGSAKGKLERRVVWAAKRGYPG
jgi:hypothetical protein